MIRAAYGRRERTWSSGCHDGGGLGAEMMSGVATVPCGGGESGGEPGGNGTRIWHLNLGPKTQIEKHNLIK
ncbi:UNVERIFIED_CONTAM: hypothetical protein Slati_4090600 [Sesamum latifolium]|uniref:Uncharacterized protein n=1 Tax=Sesamum latifolium TaxID=2727402 RepID=A0AAW2T7M9_9LAMI